MTKRKVFTADYKPDTQRQCVRCGKKIYRFQIFDGDTWQGVTPWKHFGTTSEYCDTRRAFPHDDDTA
jgi:hypothetical protein